ncbi:hypothetical protein H920_07660 [Fukomys damarensis]|uniref:Uncharacterized protein n=1 Tax=Fukomys damarensis TaxID=885580 RepID=A0A091DFJ7_FUKDA|nr:hypothetical protein H920_07660 [Fukomys damarensis]
MSGKYGHWRRSVGPQPGACGETVRNDPEEKAGDPARDHCPLQSPALRSPAVTQPAQTGDQAFGTEACGSECNRL